MDAQKQPPPPISRYKTVTVGAFDVTDLDRTALLQAIASRQGARTVVYSLHVGGLNLRDNPTFTDALHQADMLLPDGISVAALVKLAGGNMHRHPTTDLGWEILGTLSATLSRPVRVALVGGPPELARRAGVVIAENANAEIVHTTDGFHSDWTATVAELMANTPDVIFIGMGMPHEAHWVNTHLDALPPALLITCGGWFGHVVGDEKRAPAWMRKTGLEWLARLAQSPRRLWRRYTTGLWSVLTMVPTVLRSRWAKPQHVDPRAAHAPQNQPPPRQPVPAPPLQSGQTNSKE